MPARLSCKLTDMAGLCAWSSDAVAFGVGPPISDGHSPVHTLRHQRGAGYLFPPASGPAPHDLRRTVRTQFAAMGCPSDVAEAVLGHMQPGIEGVYNVHRYDAERRLWLGRLSDAWEAAAVR